MDIPQAPDDLELKTIIDKLANFVARNGPDFESMTKNKQKDNPKFSFLYGGENYNYYQFKVSSEQAVISQQKQQQVQVQAQHTISQATSPWQQNEAIIIQISALEEEIRLEEINVQNQVKQSEQNLNAQYTSLTQTQQYQVDDLVTKKRLEKVELLGQQCSMSVADFDNILQPITQSCTKDAISNGKNWIFNRAHSYMHFEFVASHLLNRILERDVVFEIRLHLIYLINDLLHHCQRKGIDQMTLQLAKIVVPAFCTTISGVDEQKHSKLDKLLTLWKKNNYFNEGAIQKMCDPEAALADYQASCVSEHSVLISSIAATIQQQYSALQIQHKEYSEHLSMQLDEKCLQLQQLRTQQQALASMVVASTINTSIPPPGLAIPPPGLVNLPPMIDQSLPPPHFAPFMPPGPGGPGPMTFDPTRPPPILPEMTMAGGGMPPMLDLSKPPPGFPEPPPPMPQPPPIQEIDLRPSVPYYDLPAGLMCPLIKMEDHEYRPLDPDKIRLPPPAPPTEKLLAAVEAFYSAPSHDAPRDGKGWERLGLYEYYKAKEAAKKRKWENRRSGSRSRSKSNSRSPKRSRSRSRTPPRRHSASRSPSPRRRSLSRSPRRSPIRRSPDRHSPRRSPDRRSPDRRSPDRSPDRSRDRSPDSGSPKRSQSGSPRRTRSRTRSRSISLSPDHNDYPMSMQTPIDPNAPISEHNKGHMLMKKMGWTGKGLGLQEQGIVDPIKGAAARDTNDKFKGIGTGAGMEVTDPFEQFRKKNSSGFINKMRTREEERKVVTPLDEPKDPKAKPNP